MIIAAAVALVFGVVLAATRFGRYTYAVGSNAEARAARRHQRRPPPDQGLRARRDAGRAGRLPVLARFATTTIGGHATDNLNVDRRRRASAARACSAASGRSLGTVFGVFIPAVLQNGFIIIGVQPFWQQVAVGAVLIAAVYLDQLRRAHAMTGT